jgi:ADP-ribose pyrophosphatase YjhB (NUDIX family)
MRVKARAVIVVDGRLVVAEEHRGGQRRLTLPGGRPARGETLTDTVIREVEEETELAVTVGPLLYVAEVVAGSTLQQLNMVFLAEPAGALPKGARTVGPDDAEREEVMPPILDRVFEDLAAGWPQTPRYLGNVRVAAAR